MYYILISSLLLSISSNAWGTEGSSLNQPSQYKEKARISWKAGLFKKLEQDRSVSSLQFPVTGELQLPLSSQFSWLLQAGGGLMLRTKKETICDPDFIPNPPKPPFDSDFFLENYERRLKKATDKDSCFFKDRKVDKKVIPYFTAQTGFKYGSNVYGILQGGIILSSKGDMGWIGELLVGKNLGWDVSIGVRMTSFNNSEYIGFVLYLGNAIKSWWTEQSLE